MHRLRSYKCTGTVTIHGNPRRICERTTDNAYLDLNTTPENDLQFAFRMNDVDAGYINVSLSNFKHAIADREDFLGLGCSAPGELPLYESQDDHAPAWLEEDTFQYTYSTYSNDPWAGTLQTPLLHDGDGGSTLFFSPAQTADFIDTLEKLRNDTTPRRLGQLVVASGDTVSEATTTQI